jgi:hypothetical protein
MENPMRYRSDVRWFVLALRLHTRLIREAQKVRNDAARERIKRLVLFVELAEMGNG